MTRTSERAKLISYTVPLHSEAMGVITTDKHPVSSWEELNREDITLVGAWDGDPDNNLISYLTPMGQAIFSSAPGEEVEFQLGEETRRLRVEAISALAS